MEFQPIIMAAGRGSRMTDLTSRIPKALLPVGNKPMIWYTVDMLEKAGFQEIIIVVLKSVLHSMKRALEEVHPVGVQLQYVTLADDNDSDDVGTADALRQLQEKIKGDMLVLSCDLIVDENMKKVIHELADIHRINDATVTMLLAPVLELADGTTVPGGRNQLRIERDVIGLDKSGQKVLFLAADSDVDQITFHLSQLKRFPFIQLDTSFVDSHVYILKQSVLDILMENRSISTVKGDLIPLLVKHQLSGKKHSKTLSSTPVGGILHEETDNNFREDFDELVRDMSTMGNCNRHITQVLDDHLGFVCCAKILKQGLCLRANTLLSYCEANKRVARLSNTQRASGTRQANIDCLIGDGVTFGEKSSVKSSVIGDQSVIGDRTKILNCVIMDHVIIESGATLTGCIVCSNACVSSGAELRECLVGVKQTVSGKHMNSMILEQDHMMI